MDDEIEKYFQYHPDQDFENTTQNDRPKTPSFEQFYIKTAKNLDFFSKPNSDWDQSSFPLPDIDDNYKKHINSSQPRSKSPSSISSSSSDRPSLSHLPIGPSENLSLINNTKSNLILNSKQTNTLLSDNLLSENILNDEMLSDNILADNILTNNSNNIQQHSLNKPHIYTNFKHNIPSCSPNYSSNSSLDSIKDYLCSPSDSDVIPTSNSINIDNTNQLLTPPHVHDTTIYKNDVNDANLKYNLTLANVPPKSRVETQIKINFSLDPAPNQTKLHLPTDTISKPKLQLRPAFQPSPDTLDLNVYIFCETQPDHVVNICSNCIKRELKRASRKKIRVQAEETHWEDKKNRSAIIFNCPEILDLTTQPNETDNKLKSVLIPMRIACYCRHHSEKIGYRVLFIVKDHQDNIVAKAITDPILITDDHKAQVVNNTVNLTPPPYQPAYSPETQNFKSLSHSAGSSPTQYAIKPEYALDLVKQNQSDYQTIQNEIHFNPNNNNFNNNIQPEENYNTLNSSFSSGQNLNNQDQNMISSSSVCFDNKLTSPATYPTSSNTSFSFTSSASPSYGFPNHSSTISEFPVNDLCNFLPNQVQTSTSTKMNPTDAQIISAESQTQSESFNVGYKGIFPPNNKIRNKKKNSNLEQKKNNPNRFVSRKRAATASETEDVPSGIRSSSSDLSFEDHNNNKSKESTSINNFSSYDNALNLQNDGCSQLKNIQDKDLFTTSPNSNSLKPLEDSPSLKFNNEISSNSTQVKLELPENLQSMQVNILPTNNNPVNPSLPVTQRIIPAQGSIRGGIEVTLLGAGFYPGLVAKFGDTFSIYTTCWSSSTIICQLPPSSNPGPVLVTFDKIPAAEPQVFTYTDDTDQQLMELALKVVGLKMSGKLEDARNIAMKIVGNTSSSFLNDSADSSGRGSLESSLNKLTLDHDYCSNATSSTKETLLSNSSSSGSKIPISSSSLMPNLSLEACLLRCIKLIDLNDSVYKPNWQLSNFEGQTLLHLAAFRGLLKLVKYLLIHGAYADVQDHSGYTPLHFACLCKHSDVICVLLDAGADPTMRTYEGSTAVQLVKGNKRLEYLFEKELYSAQLKKLKFNSFTRKGRRKSCQSLLSKPVGTRRSLHDMKSELLKSKDFSSSDDCISSSYNTSTVKDIFIKKRGGQSKVSFTTKEKKNKNVFNVENDSDRDADEAEDFSGYDEMDCESENRNCKFARGNWHKSSIKGHYYPSKLQNQESNYGGKGIYKSKVETGIDEKVDNEEENKFKNIEKSDKDNDKSVEKDDDNSSGAHYKKDINFSQSLKFMDSLYALRGMAVDRFNKLQPVFDTQNYNSMVMLMDNFKDKNMKESFISALSTLFPGKGGNEKEPVVNSDTSVENGENGIMMNFQAPPSYEDIFPQKSKETNLESSSFPHTDTDGENKVVNEESLDINNDSLSCESVENTDDSLKDSFGVIFNDLYKLRNDRMLFIFWLPALMVFLSYIAIRFIDIDIWATYNHISEGLFGTFPENYSVKMAKKSLSIKNTIS